MQLMAFSFKLQPVLTVGWLLVHGAAAGAGALCSVVSAPVYPGSALGLTVSNGQCPEAVMCRVDVGLKC